MTLNNSKIHFILLAGGNSLRFSSNTNKLLAKFKNKNLLIHNIEFIKELKFKKISLVVKNIKKADINSYNGLELIKGGKTRSESVKNALNKSNFIYNAERSFGKDSDRVFFHARNVVDAHRENNIITVLKHFPGHGSSSTDTHKEFTDVSNSWIVEELFPYHKLMIEDKVDGIMTSLVVNSKIDDSLLPATLSEKSINKLLREFLDYEGVVFSDDMQMGAITKNYGLKEAITYAINAGVDVLIFSNNQLYKDLVTPNEVISIIEEGILNGDISLLRVNESFRRIQNLKKKINLIK